jgi:surface carbohydrate biosynthesis protein
MTNSRIVDLPTVYICIEVKNRELDSQVLLAVNLAKKGFRCILGTHDAIFSVLRAKKFKSGIFLDKGTLPISRMKWIKTKCESIVILDQELGPTLENPSEHLKDWPGRIYPGADELIDKYLCVGPKVFEAALDRFNGDFGKVVMTGWPRVDIWNKLGAQVYRKEIAQLQNKYGQFLLFVSDFGVNEDESVFFEGLKSFSQNDERFKKTISTLRRWDKSKHFSKIVIRPHITEDVRFWRKVLGDVHRTEVNKDFNVTPWVLASKGVIHTGSTVAFEAKLAGKDVFYLKEASPRQADNFADLVSDCVISLNHEGQLPIIDPEKETLPSEVHEYVSLSEVSSVDRVIHELISLKSKHEKSIDIISLFISQIRLRTLLRLFGLLRHEINWKLKIAKNPPYSHCVPGGISRKDFAKVMSLNDENFHVKIRPITMNCWEFSKTTQRE